MHSVSGHPCLGGDAQTGALSAACRDLQFEPLPRDTY